MEPLSLVVIIVFIALLFDFFNGFNDAANSIATIVEIGRASCRDRVWIRV